MVGNQRQGWAVLSVMGILFMAGVIVCYWAEANGTAMMHAPRPHRRQHGRQGSALRHRRLGALRGGHHRCLVRRGQRHARLVHRARRHDPAHQHPARRDHHRRRRRRALRHAAVRHRVDLRGRPDGGADARIRRQEDRGEGGEDGHARHPHPAADVPRLDGARRGHPFGGGLDRERRAARLQRDPLPVHVEHGQQRLGLRRHRPATRPSTTSPARWRCSSAASG